MTRLVGYGTTIGDNVKATIRATAAITGMTVTAGYMIVENIIFDGNATGTVGVSFSGCFGSALVNCKVMGWTGSGVLAAATYAKVIDSEVTGCGGTNAAVEVSSGICNIEGCNIHGNTSAGVAYLGAGNIATVNRNRIWGNTGGSSDGVLLAPSSYGLRVDGNTIHGNGRDGIRMTSYNINTGVRNNILTSNGGYGLNILSLAGTPVDLSIDYNWFGSGALANTSGARNAIAAGPHDLSGDPGYTSAGTGNFTPTNAAVQAGSP